MTVHLLNGDSGLALERIASSVQGKGLAFPKV